MTKKWLRFLGIWAASLLVLGVIICAVLYKYCAVYEQTRPDPVIEEIMTTMSPSQWYSAALENCNLDVNEFEDAKAIYQAYLKDAKTDDSKISYRKEVTLSDSDHTVYSIRSGISPIATVTLVPDTSEKYAFGRHNWMLGSITAPNILKNLSSYDVVIYAPVDKQIEVNGKIIDSSYVTNDNAQVPTTNQFETSIKLSQTYVEYDLGKMYGNVVVKDYNGSELSATVDNGKLIYVAKPDNVYSIKITAPEDVNVYINDIVVDKLSGTIADVLFDEIHDYTNGNEYNIVSYTFNDFFNEPVVSAVDANGNSLIPIVSGNRRYSFLHINEKETQTEFEDLAETFFTRYTDYATSKYNSGTAWSLLNRCLRHSELFDYILNSEDTMIWTTSIETTYSDVNFDNFSMVGDDCFVCSVKYTIEQTSTDWKETTNKYLDYAYELVFVNYDGTWVCAKMEAISE